MELSYYWWNFSYYCQAQINDKFCQIILHQKQTPPWQHVPKFLQCQCSPAYYRVLMAIPNQNIKGLLNLWYTERYLRCSIITQISLYQNIFSWHKEIHNDHATSICHWDPAVCWDRPRFRRVLATARWSWPQAMQKMTCMTAWHIMIIMIYIYI